MLQVRIVVAGPRHDQVTSSGGVGVERDGIRLRGVWQEVVVWSSCVAVTLIHNLNDTCSTIAQTVWHPVPVLHAVYPSKIQTAFHFL